MSEWSISSQSPETQKVFHLGKTFCPAHNDLIVKIYNMARVQVLIIRIYSMALWSHEQNPKKYPNELYHWLIQMGSVLKRYTFKKKLIAEPTCAGRHLQPCRGLGVSSVCNGLDPGSVLSSIYTSIYSRRIGHEHLLLWPENAGFCSPGTPLTLPPLAPIIISSPTGTEQKTYIMVVDSILPA